MGGGPTQGSAHVFGDYSQVAHLHRDSGVYSLWARMAAFRLGIDVSFVEGRRFPCTPVALTILARLSQIIPETVQTAIYATSLSLYLSPQKIQRVKCRVPKTTLNPIPPTLESQRKGFGLRRPEVSDGSLKSARSLTTQSKSSAS